MAGISIDSKTSSSVTLFLSGLDTSWTNGTRTVYWYLGSAGGGIPTSSAYSQKKTTTLANAVSSGGSVTFTGLSENTQYGVYCEIYHNSTLLASLQGYARTDVSGSGGGGDGEETQSWTVYNAGSKTSLTGDMQTSLVFIPYRICRYAVSFAYSGTATFYTTGSAVDTYGFLTTSTSFDSANGKPTSSAILVESDSYEGDFNGGDDGLNFSITYSVKAGTTYYIWVREYYGTERGATTLCITSPSESTTIDIAKWDWYSSNGSNASASQTISAYNAINGTGAGRSTKNFSYKVWNDMVDKVKQISDEAVGWWDTDYATYANTKMSGPNETLTAVMFNSLRNNLEIAGYQKLSLGYRTGIGQVFSGDTVYGDYFETLADYINDCIDNL